MNPVLQFVLAMPGCGAVAYAIERGLDRVGEWWSRARDKRRRRPF